MARIGLISLGCPKNLVDSEGALGEIAQAGHEIVSDVSRADVIIINTCGFIDSAREESVQTILEALQYKQNGSCRAVIVIGCLSQRFSEELDRELRDVDAFLGVGHAGAISATIDSVLAGRRIVRQESPPCEWIEPVAKVQATPPWTAYLKISDGCDNRCTYCAIPDIRGRFRSRPEPLIIDEAKRLVDAGVRELILVGQDATQYGADLPERSCLPELLYKLNEIEGLRWVRLMYCYPSKVTPDLIEAVASCEKVVKYLDLPLQHGDDRVLQAMNRKGRSADYLRVIDSLRERCPDIALRTSLIVGFPGETNEAFDNLLAFVERIQFDRVGVFVYSREDGTPAAKLKDRVSRKKARARYDALMTLQQGISLRKNQAFVGRQMEVLVEGSSEDGVFGRSYRDAPEIDGLVYVRSHYARPGDFINVTITGATEYDLITEETRE